MTEVTRFSMEYDYNPVDPPSCTCSVEEDPEGYYVEYSEYKKLESYYDQEVERRRRQPAQFDLKDVTQRTMLHSAMNEHMAWLIKLTLYLDCRVVNEDMVKLRSFLANKIDQRSKEVT